MSSLYDIIKRISVEANEAEKNDKMLIGKVISCKTARPIEDNKYEIFMNPLEIQLSDKIILKDGDSFLKMTKTMRNNVDNNEVPLYFNVGDTVLIMRTDKGKSYLLIDKTGD